MNMKPIVRVLCNSAITSAITFLSAAAMVDFAGAWKPAVISAAISGVLSGLIELKEGLSEPGSPAGPVGPLKKMRSRRKGQSFIFGYV